MPWTGRWTVMVLAAALSTGGAGLPVRGEVPPTRGEVLFRCAFDKPQSVRGLQGLQSGQVELVPGREGRTALCVRIPAGKPAGAGARIDLDAKRLAGCRIRLVAVVKADNVAKPPNPWNGVEVMLHMVASDGGHWVQPNGEHGTFDWKKVGTVVDVPADAKAISLHLGLEQTHGAVWFEQVEITCLTPPRTRPASRPTGPVYKGHNLPRLRGTMINRRVSADDLRVLASWGANHVRWQLNWNSFPHSPADNGDLAAYDKWIEGTLKKLDELLPVCHELGILVTVDLHTPPGGRDKALSFRLFQEKRFQDKFVELWKGIARRYRGNASVWGYDLVNEPVEGLMGEELMDWPALAEHTARAVREIDGDHAIIIEPAPWGSIEGLKHFQPLNVPRVVYSVHMYQPHAFTHQGVYGPPTNLSYPGPIAGKHWDKAAIRRAFQVARDFQLDYGAHIYIGEFSAIRWAPGDSACNYLRDVIDVMEEYGWDWAYHAFREWQGWSVEHGGDRNDTRPSATPTDRQKLLQSWFKQNRRPN